VLKGPGERASAVVKMLSQRTAKTVRGSTEVDVVQVLYQRGGTGRGCLMEGVTGNSEQGRQGQQNGSKVDGACYYWS